MSIKNQDAVSPILGTLMLLLISLTLFSIIFSVVSGLEPVNKGPSLQILAYNADDKIVIDHFGGESIDIRSNLILNMENEDVPIKIEIGECMQDSSKIDGFWNIGEQIIYEHNSTQMYYFTKNFSDNHKDIRFSIVDYSENSIIVSGNIKI